VSDLAGAGAACADAVGAASWAGGASITLVLVVGVVTGLPLGRLTVLVALEDFFGGIVSEQTETLNLLELEEILSIEVVSLLVKLCYLIYMNISIVIV
jgi:hypothetical protein